MKNLDWVEQGEWPYMTSNSKKEELLVCVRKLNSWMNDCDEGGVNSFLSLDEIERLINEKVV